MSNGDAPPPLLNDLAQIIVEGFFSPEMLSRVERIQKNAVVEGNVTSAGVIRAAEIEAIESAEFVIKKVELLIKPFIGPILAAIIGHMLGLDVSASQLDEAAKSGEGNALGRVVADTFFSAMTPPSTDIEPSDEGARRFMAMVATFVISSWSEGIVWSESIGASHLIPGLEAMSELGQRLVNSLGLSRLMRVALRPLVDETISTPLRWKINNTYKPSRLNASQIIRQLARERMTHDQAFAELNREGWTDERIEAMFNEAARFLSLQEQMFLVLRGERSEDQVVQDLQNQGYDKDTGRAMINAYKEARLLAIEDDILTGVKAAYIAHDIEEPEFRKDLEIFVKDPDELQAQLDVGGILRETKKTRLTHAEVQAAVKAGILAITDYRIYMEEKNYPPDEQLTLELLLVHEMNAKADLAAHKAQVLADRTAKAAATLLAKQQKQAQIDAARALHQQGSITELRHAVIIGTIPEARYIQVLNGYYDPDTVQILTDVVEHDRQVYLDTQARADAARKKAAVKNIDIRLREAAVLAGVDTLDAFQQQLLNLTVDPADVQLLVDTLKGKLADQAAAQTKKSAAAAKAASKHLNLAQFELLVRKGHRTMAEYDAFLVSLGEDDAARAGIEELLTIKISEDQAAAATRAANAAKKDSKGATLAEVRRAVILGAEPIATFQQFLIDAKFDVPSQQLLLAELKDDVASADAARQKRAAAAAAKSSPQLSIAQLARAARLSLIPPAAYSEALTDAGYSADDVAIDMDLLTVEIADQRAKEAKAAALLASKADHGLSLAQTEASVLSGAEPIDAYAAKAASLGFDQAAVADLMVVLQEKLAARQDAEARRAQIAAKLATTKLSLAELEQAVKDGLKTFDQFRQTLLDEGFSQADAELLVSLLAAKLGVAAPAA